MAGGFFGWWVVFMDGGWFLWMVGGFYGWWVVFMDGGWFFLMVGGGFAEIWVLIMGIFVRF